MSAATGDEESSADRGAPAESGQGDGNESESADAESADRVPDEGEGEDDGDTVGTDAGASDTGGSTDDGAQSEATTPDELAEGSDVEAPASSADGGSPEEATADDTTQPEDSTDDGTSEGEVEPEPRVDLGRPSSAPRTCGEELHVVGIYEPEEDLDPSIHISRPGAHILVLSAYHQTNWVVTVDEDVVLEKVIVSGYEPQSVQVPDGVEVELYDYQEQDNQPFDYAYRWSQAWNLGDPEGLVGTVENMTGRRLTTFNGCYRLTSYELGSDLSADVVCGEAASSHTNVPECGDSVPDPEPLPQVTPPIPDEDLDAWCWTVSPVDDGGLALMQVDMATGEWFEAGRYYSPDYAFSGSFSTSGLALFDNALIMAGYVNEDQWMHMDLSTGLVTIGGSSDHVSSVATNGRELFAECDTGVLCAYAGFLDLAHGYATREITLTGAQGTRFAIAQDTVYTAWHSTNEVNRHELATGDWLGVTSLESWEGWVHGLSVLGDRLYVMGDNRQENQPEGTRLSSFEVDSGAIVDDVFLPSLVVGLGPSGLWCGGVPR
jgi:hypothetical protein